jgi:phosphate starvation-inducible protein PhoH and related proteins
MSVRKKTTPQSSPTVNEESLRPLSKKEIIGKIIKKKTKDKFLTENQKRFYYTLINNEITICSGPAGVGKSYLVMKAAIDLILNPDTPYEKLIIVRPAVESSDSKLGSLPGDLREKMDPYVYASLYLLHKIIGKDTTEKLEETGFIEIMSLSFMRGINVDNAVLIVEETQNATPSEMKMVLTRIGFNSKFFISGDIEQSDKFRQKEKSGLYDIINRLENIKGIEIFKFGPDDVVRNPIIKEILKKYEE